MKYIVILEQILKDMLMHVVQPVHEYYTLSYFLAYLISLYF